MGARGVIYTDDINQIIYTDDINQNILWVLRTLSNLQERIYEKLYTKVTTSKAPTTEFLSKIPNRKKISNEDLRTESKNVIYNNR